VPGGPARARVEAEIARIEAELAGPAGAAR